jgi:hypothetical protein
MISRGIFAANAGEAAQSDSVDPLDATSEMELY